MACTVSLRRIFYELRVMPIFLVDWSDAREQLRMMTLRDLKSPQYIGLRQSRSCCPKRYDVLLLIAMLDEIVSWCIELAALTPWMAEIFSSQYSEKAWSAINC